MFKYVLFTFPFLILITYHGSNNLRGPKDFSEGIVVFVAIAIVMLITRAFNKD